MLDFILFSYVEIYGSSKFPAVNGDPESFIIFWRDYKENGTFISFFFSLLTLKTKDFTSALNGLISAHEQMLRKITLFQD